VRTRIGVAPAAALVTGVLTVAAHLHGAGSGAITAGGATALPAAREESKMIQQDATAPVVLELPNGRMVGPDVATGGQPDVEQIEELAAAGFRTVVDLRTADEPRGFDEAAAVRAAGMEYINLPVGTHIGDETFAALRAILDDAGKGPVLVHCASGNRVGGALIPHLVLDRGIDLETAVRTGFAIGLRTREFAMAGARYVRDNGSDPYKELER
jgi:uncharacterized protein (TIGR01244 family)